MTAKDYEELIEYAIDKLTQLKIQASLKIGKEERKDMLVKHPHLGM